MPGAISGHLRVRLNTTSFPDLLIVMTAEIGFDAAVSPLRFIDLWVFKILHVFAGPLEDFKKWKYGVLISYMSKG